MLSYEEKNNWKDQYNERYKLKFQKQQKHNKQKTENKGEGRERG